MKSKADTLVFDLDNTLYSPDSGLLSTVSGRISQYIMHRMGLSQTDADEMRVRYRMQYGITLSGLVRHHNICPIDFDTFVYDIDYMSKLEPDTRLRNLIAALPYKKAVYTNAGRRHTGIVLERLGLAGLFNSIVAIEDLDFAAKPTEESFNGFLQLTGIDPHRAVFFEDSAENLDTAKRFGFSTVLVGAENADYDHALPDIYAIEQLFA